MKEFLKTLVKNKKVMIIAIVLVVVIVAGVIFSSVMPQNSDSGKITRAQWVQMLGEKFGYTQYAENEPFFTDINNEHQLFSIVQALKEDGVIEYEGTFNPNKKVTFDEMLVNVSRIYGEDYIISRINKETATQEDIKAYIRNCSVYSANYSDNSVLTKKEATAWINEIHIDWLNREFKSTFSSVTKPQVKDEMAKTEYILNENTLIFNTETNLSAGDILLLGANDEYPQGTARKIEAITNNDGNNYTLTVSAVKIEDVFETFDLEFSKQMEEGGFVAAEGVTIVEENQEGILFNIEPTCFNGKANSLVPLDSFSSSKDGVFFNRSITVSSNTLPSTNKKPLTVNPDYPGMAFNNADTIADGVFLDENGNKKSKFNTGFELKCGLKLSNFKLNGSMDWNGTIYFSEFNVNVSMDITPYFELRGNATESFKLGSIPCSIGYGFFANIDLFVVISIDGEISVEPVISCGGTVRKAKSAYIPRATGEANCTTSVSVSADLGVQVGPDVTLSFLDIADFVDAYVFIGVGASTAWDNRQPAKLNVEFYLPTLHIGVGHNEDTLLSILLDVFRDPKIDFAVIDNNGGVWNCPVTIKKEFQIMKKEPLKWNFENGVLTVSGNVPEYRGEEMAPWFKGTQQDQGTAEEPNPVNVEIKKVVIEEGVMHIGSGAFSALSGLTEIVLPKTLVSIGDYAFEGCEELKEITLPDSVTYIGKGAFCYNPKLQKVTMSKNLTKIGAEAFWDCTALKEINIPDSVETIGMNAFANCTSLKTVNFGKGVKQMGREAFMNCTALENITLPEKLTRVPMKTFYNCTNLKEIAFSGNTKTLGMLAFGNCRALTKIVNKDAVKETEQYVFYNCVGLGEFDYGDQEVWEDKY